MEYEVLNFPDTDYNFFFKELPKHFVAAQPKGKKKKSLENSYSHTMFEQLEESVVFANGCFASSTIDNNPGLPFDPYSEERLRDLICSQQYSFYKISSKGQDDIHYLNFEGRILEIKADKVNWRVDWQSELIPRWLRIAYGELGTKEIKGGKHNQRILEYSGNITEEYDNTVKEKVLDPITKKFRTERRVETATKKVNINDDETAWCSYFVHWVMQQVGITGPQRLPGLAASWKDWGTKLQKPAFGCLAVMKHKKSGGHVGFVVGEEDGNVVLLGGNQSNQVNFWHLKSHSQSEIIAYVYPPSNAVDGVQYYLHSINEEVTSRSNNTR